MEDNKNILQEDKPANVIELDKEQDHTKEDGHDHSTTKQAVAQDSGWKAHWDLLLSLFR